MHQGAPCDALVVALEGRLAATLASDLDAGFNYLREQDAKLLVEWMQAPYSA